MTIITGHPATITPAGRAYNLTNREQQVLERLVQGLSNRQIAAALDVKFHTVSTHVKSIYKKIGLHKRSTVVAKVLTDGFLNSAGLVPSLVSDLLLKDQGAVAVNRT